LIVLLDHLELVTDFWHWTRSNPGRSITPGEKQGGLKCSLVRVTNPGAQIQAQMEWADMTAFRFCLKQRDSHETVQLVETDRSLFDYGFRSDTVHVCLYVPISLCRPDSTVWYQHLPKVQTSQPSLSRLSIYCTATRMMVPVRQIDQPFHGQESWACRLCTIVDDDDTHLACSVCSTPRYETSVKE
jgi:hypothetical protein